MKFIFALLILSVTANAATIIANSLSRADVNTALQSASAGDTVVLPAGSGGVANWTSGISWTAPANVTVIGAGTSAIGGGDQTVIQDNYNSGLPLIHITVSPTGTFRFSGITIQSGTASTFKDNGTLTIDGPGTVRIDHCHFIPSSGYNFKIVKIGSGLRGVCDTSIFDLTTLNAVYVYNGRSSGAGDQAGNYEWSQPTAFGSSDFFFFEDNQINGVGSLGGVIATRFLDCFTAAKVVVRFNSLYRSCVTETHATGHAGDDRGSRAQEVYGNLCTTDYDGMTGEPSRQLADISNGTGLAWGNSAVDVYKSMFISQVTRAAGISGGGTYNQQPTPQGWGYAGTNFNGTGSNWDGGTFNGTDTLYGYPAIDQPGRGVGDLLDGLFPSKVNTATGTIRWPDQALEPIYTWSNVGNFIPGWGGAQYSVDVNRVFPNQDYYPQAVGIQTTPASPFNGTTGVGWGTLANRPTTCTTGVAYWATDQGSWNQSSSNPQGVQQNGADGVLYVATSTNTWTLYYEPYTYPHPLRNTNQVSQPQFSPAAGSYATVQNVTITTGTSGATIRYTTDGSTPTNSYGTVYSAPVGIPSTTTLKAIAYNGVLDDSIVTTGVYNIGGSAGDGVVTGTSTVTTTLTLP